MPRIMGCWTMFVLSMKFRSVLTITCGYEWLFDGGFLVEQCFAIVVVLKLLH